MLFCYFGEEYNIWVLDKRRIFNIVEGVLMLDVSWICGLMRRRVTPKLIIKLQAENIWIFHVTLLLIT
jgi:hypothetical protein